MSVMVFYSTMTAESAVKTDKSNPFGYTSDELYKPETIRSALDKEQKEIFRYFWESTEPEVGLTQENDNSTNKFTLGGGGFGIMASIVGVERGWVSREKAAKRIATTAEFLDNEYRIHGVWSHWINREGKPLGFGNKQKEAGDVVETSFMLMGMLCAAEYFDGDTKTEKTIREKAEYFVNSIEWDFYTNGKDHLYWCWDRPSNNFILPISGYNEALITYILGMGAPDRHRITYRHYKGGWMMGGEIWNPGRISSTYPWPLGKDVSGPMFLSHYSFLGMDPRDMQDEYVNYYDNCVYHAMINHHYCLYEAPEEYGYDEWNWGLTACFGTGKRGYRARSPRVDDGVIAPTAAIGSMPYTPFYSIQVLMNLLDKERMSYIDKKGMDTKMGFWDSYSVRDKQHTDLRISIDQGPMIIMIENYRSGLFWNLMANNAIIKKGQKEAGIGPATFKPGFFYIYENTVSGCADLIRHPDREVYEMPYWTDSASKVTFVLTSETGETTEITTDSKPGKNMLSFGLEKLETGCRYKVTMNLHGKLVSQRQVILH